MEPLNYAFFYDPWYHLSYPRVTPILPTWMAKDLEISVARVGRIATNKEWKMWCPKGKPANDRPLFAKLGKKTQQLVFDNRATQNQTYESEE